MEENYYKILNVDENATKSEIKKAYYAQCKKWHPDVCKEPNATEMFKKVNEAYQTLYDDEKRKRYDQYLNIDYDDGVEFESDNYFDVSILNEYMRQPFRRGTIHSFLSSLPMNQVIMLYEYFWITFWSGSSLSEAMLRTKSLSQWFKVFFDFDYIKHDLYDDVKLYAFANEETKANFKEYRDHFISRVDSIIDSLKSIDSPNNSSKKSKYFNFMVDIINDDNIFDNSFSAYLALNCWRKVNEMFLIFEKVYDQCDSLSNDGERSIHNDKFRYKKEASGISAIAVVIIVIVVLLIWYYY